MNETRPKKHLFRSIGWLLLGIIGGVIIVVIFLLLLGTFRGMYVHQSLPAPEEIHELKVIEGDKTFVFDRIEYNEYDLSRGKELQEIVTPGQYGKIVEFLFGSSPVVRDDFLENKFEEDNPANLTIYVRPEDNRSNGLGYPYQTIEFLKDSDYLRIKNPEKQGPETWDYYRQPLAYSRIKEILKEK